MLIAYKGYTACRHKVMALTLLAGAVCGMEGSVVLWELNVLEAKALVS